MWSNFLQLRLGGSVVLEVDFWRGVVRLSFKVRTG